MFEPALIDLAEAGGGHDMNWTMSAPLRWTGQLGGEERTLVVPASKRAPFTTDLASVPTAMTWLIPRYGRYTKAAIVHDFLCQRFRQPPSAADDTVRPLRDRSDADEVFRVLMGDLGVSLLQRWLMWTAVAWATLFTYLVPGRRSSPLTRWLGRAVVVVGLVVLLVRVVAHHDGGAYVGLGLGAPLVVLLGGLVALERIDRVPDYALAYVLTVLFSPLLAVGVGLMVLLAAFLLVQDLVQGLPRVRHFFRCFGGEARAEAFASPQFARLAAVHEGPSPVR